MQTFLINLDRAPERRAWIEARLKVLKVRYRRLAAVDGNSLSGQDVEHLTRPESRENPLSLAEIACFLSHRKCWEVIVRENITHAAILEDDVYLSEFSGRLLSSESWIPKFVRVLKIEATHPDLFIGFESEPSPDLRIYKSGDAWVGSAGYIVTKQAARALLEFGPISCPVDKFLFDKAERSRLFDTHEIRPGVCIQASHFGEVEGFLASTIGVERMRMPSPRKPPKPKASTSLIAKIVREAARPIKRLRRKLTRLLASKVRLPERIDG